MKKNDFIKKFIIKGIIEELEKEVNYKKDFLEHKEILENIRKQHKTKLKIKIKLNDKNYTKKTIKEQNEKDIYKLQKESYEIKTIKKELKKRLLKLGKKNRSNYKNIKTTKTTFSRFEKELYITSEKIVNKALKILTYINDKKWNLKNDTLIVDYFNKLKEKEDLIHDTILSILQYGYIFENVLYIRKKQFKTINTTKNNKITLLHNYKHYKNINKILYHAKKEKSMVTTNTQKTTYKNDKESTIDLYEVKAFNDYISKNIEVNDLKLKYQKLTKRNISNNILKLLNLSNKEKMIFAYRLQGVEYKTIAKVFNINIKTVGVVVTRINQKIEKVKNELYINYMK